MLGLTVYCDLFFCLDMIQILLEFFFFNYLKKLLIHAVYETRPLVMPSWLSDQLSWYDSACFQVTISCLFFSNNERL